MMQRHAVALAEFFHARADPDNGARGFMSENAGRRHRAVLDFFDVGGANAAGSHLDQQLIGLDARHRHGLETQIIHAAINDCAHRFRNSRHALGLTTDEHG